MDTKDLKLAIREVLDEKLDPIKKDIENIKVNLTNHVSNLTDKLNTIDGNYQALKTDVSWLKKLFDPKGNVANDVRNKADINWLKWAVRGIITAVLAQVIAVIVLSVIK